MSIIRFLTPIIGHVPCLKKLPSTKVKSIDEESLKKRKEWRKEEIEEGRKEKQKEKNQKLPYLRHEVFARL